MCPGLRQVVPALLRTEAIVEPLRAVLDELTDDSGDTELRRDCVSLALSARIGLRVLDTLRTRRVRPIIVSSHHASALPQWPHEGLADVLAYALRARLPFDHFAIDFDHAGLEYECVNGPGRMLAAIVERVGYGVRITPLVHPPDAARGGVLAMLPTLWTTERVRGGDDEIVIAGETIEAHSNTVDALQETATAVVRSLTQTSIALADRVLMTLRMIESLNVTIVQATANRQLRRNAGNVTFHVPSIVEIRRTRSKRTVPLGEPGRRLRYRHEVIGHWKLHGENSPIWHANQDQLVYVPGVGEVVQVWCPDYVQGPAGAPIRLKVWKLDGYVDHEDDA